MAKKSLKQFIEIITEVADQFGFDDAECAFWQCNVFSQAVYQIAFDMDVNIKSIKMILVEAEFQADVGDVHEGDIHRHVLLKINDKYYDWTIKQIDPNADFPYISKKLPKYFKYLGETFKEDVLQGFDYYPELLKRKK